MPDPTQEEKDTAARMAEAEAKVKAIAEKAIEEKGYITKEDVDAGNAALLEEVKTKYKSEGVSVPGVDEGKEKFMIGKAAHCMKTGDWGQAGYEKEVLDETKKVAIKVMGSQALSGGAALIPTQVSMDLIQRLTDEPIIAKLGANMMTGLTGSPVHIPKITSGSTGYMVAESAEPTASDMGFGLNTMTPKTGAALVKASNNLIDLSSWSVEKLIRDDIVRTLGLLMDAQCFQGTGGSNELLGLVNQGGNLNTVTMGTGNGGAITIAKINDFLAAQEVDLTLNGKLAWVFNPRTINTIRQFKGTTDERYYFAPELWNSMKQTIYGYPFYTTNQIPKNLTTGSTSTCTEILFGDWSRFIVGMWKNLEIKVLDQASDASANSAALLNQLWFVAFMRFDCTLRHNRAFTVSTDVTS